MNLVNPSAFNEIRHIEISVTEVSGIILFHILHVVGIGHELMSIITTEYDIEDIIDEINVNHDLKGAVKTVAEPPHIELPIDLTEMPGIHVNLLLELKPDAVRG